MIQFSVFMANKPGVLAKICRDLARAKVNIEALTMMDAQEHGVLRLLTDKLDETRHVLRDASVPLTETEVLAVDLANRPGAVADVCEKLSAAHIQINYVYCTAGSVGGKSTAVFKVPDIKKAMKVIDNHRGGTRDMKLNRRPQPTRR